METVFTPFIHIFLLLPFYPTYEEWKLIPANEEELMKKSFLSYL